MKASNTNLRTHLLAVYAIFVLSSTFSSALAKTISCRDAFATSAVKTPTKAYAVIEMPRHWLEADYDDDINYFDKFDLDEVRVRIKEGRLYDFNGDLLNRHGSFVMNRNGTLYFDEVQSEFTSRRHSSFLAGKPVAAAGEMEVRDGLPIYINNNSGHYHPPPQLLAQVRDQLRHRKVPTDQIKWERWEERDTNQDDLMIEMSERDFVIDDAFLEHLKKINQEIRSQPMPDQIQKPAEIDFESFPNLPKNSDSDVVKQNSFWNKFWPFGPKR